MGKGLSASLTAMIMTSFINHLIDRMIEYDSFSLDILVKESMDYIKPILLDEEALAIDYILLDIHYNKLQYAKFAMPAFLLQDKNDEIIRIKSNNPPLSKWQSCFVVDEYETKEIGKFLFYTDGIVENGVNTDKDTYAEHIEDDFRHSSTREELKGKIFEKLSTQEDDLTLIFIHKLDLSRSLISHRSFETSLSDVDVANEWYTELWSDFSQNQKDIYSANLVFTELFMNAYEHGNLGISSQRKHTMLEEDSYFDTLLGEQKSCEKKIHVSIYKTQNDSCSYIITKIEDEGEGFDTQILSQIFRNAQNFNGRGVFVSRRNSMGI
jgi:two-component system, HptB-dependent secretion and biofilm response regulator